jgi:uncharacterized RDD family membrane protein YckC
VVESHRSDPPALRLRLADTLYSLRAARVLVGRSRSCDVRLKDDTVSRLHAALVWHGADLFLEDLGSSNGTYLNGRRLTDAAPVVAGDVVRFGSVSAVIDGPPGTKKASAVPPLSSDYTTGIVPGPPAPIGQRLLAAALDAALFLVGSVVPFGPYLAARLAERYLLAPSAIPPSVHTKGIIALGCGLLWVVYAWYYVIHGWARRGGTPGMRLTGLRLVDDRMRAPIGYRRAWLRLLGALATTLTLGLGFISTLRRSDRRALHDIIAGTMVVRRTRAL